MTAWCRNSIVVGSATALAALSAGMGASAEGPRVVRVEYDAPAECPNERSFEAQIRGRSSKIAIATESSSSAPVRVRVRVAPHGGHFEGDLVLSDPRAREARRHVEGACVDVVAALALVTALALDPTASLGNDLAAPALDASAPVAPPAIVPASSPPPPPAAPPSPPPPALVEPPHEASRRAVSDAEPLRDEDARAHSWGWSIGAHVGVTEGVVPSALVSVPGFVDVWRRAPGLLAPALRLRFERAESETASAVGARFTWTAGSVDVCPVALATGRFRFWPCARAEGGALEATGSGLALARTETRPWLTLGFAARLRLTLVGSLFVEGEAGAFAPVVRDRFFVEPDATVQRAPAIAAAGAAGVGVTFW